MTLEELRTAICQAINAEMEDMEEYYRVVDWLRDHDGKRLTKTVTDKMGVELGRKYTLHQQRFGTGIYWNHPNGTKCELRLANVGKGAIIDVEYILKNNARHLEADRRNEERILFMMGDGSDAPKQIDTALPLFQAYLDAHEALKAWEQEHTMHVVKYTVLGLLNAKPSFERELR